MVKKQHKVLSLILCLILAVSAVCAGTVGAFAATGDMIYAKANNGWSELYCYMWGDGLGENKAWPGVKMDHVEDNIYSYLVTNEYDKIIFNNGSGGSGNQTSDLTYTGNGGNGKIYDLSAGKWETYIENPTTGTVPTTTPTPTVTNPVDDGNGITVYLNNTAGWSKANCYMWNSESDKNASWPGLAMTNIGGNVWQYTSSKAFANCIFNDGSTQTDDLTAKDGYIFDNSTKTWSVYDTSPLQVTSFEANPASGVYVDSDVTLSAAASNKSGATVYYKFSVTNANGATSVVSDFSSANSVVWTPKTTGTYTITFDFKDSDGNTNNRTTNITVNDDSALVKPVLKGITPANLNLIKVGSNTTVNVKAGGGITGTNLLFYKYTVTDPNGALVAPAYYTLNNTYTFKPTMVGKYTVQVHVQGSDNSTVNNTYEYTATNADITDPTINTLPPTQPTTQPTTGPDVVLGDVDGDGILTVKDATYLQKYVVGYEGCETINEAAADVDGDTRITVKDATAIQKILVGMTV